MITLLQECLIQQGRYRLTNNDRMQIECIKNFHVKNENAIGYLKTGKQLLCGQHLQQQLRFVVSRCTPFKRVRYPPLKIPSLNPRGQSSGFRVAHRYSKQVEPQFLFSTSLLHNTPFQFFSEPASNQESFRVSEVFQQGNSKFKYFVMLHFQVLFHG